MGSDLAFMCRNGSKDREPKKRQSVYFTNEQWDALHRRKGGLSITAGRLPVTHPGRPWMHHISAHLHFSTWEVGFLLLSLPHSLTCCACTRRRPHASHPA